MKLLSLQTKSFLALLSAAIIIGTFGLFVRWLSHDFLPYQQIAFRNVLGLVISIGLLLISGQSIKTIKNVHPIIGIAYTFTFPVAIVLFTLSILETKIVTSVFALYIGSILSSLALGIVVAKEKMTYTKAFCIALSIIGLFIFSYPVTITNLGRSFWFACGAGIFESITFTFRKFLSNKVDRFALVVLQLFGSVLIAFALIFSFGQTTIPRISDCSWIIGIVWALALISISYLTIIGFEHFDLNLGTIVMSSELFFAALFAWLVFGEAVTILELIGSLFIVIASGLTNTTIIDDLMKK